MRVLHVTPYFPPTWAYGGIPRVVHGLARAQVALGAEVRVWTTDVYDAERRADVAPRRTLDGIEVVVSPVVSNRLAWSHQLFLPRGEPPMEDVDLLHLHAHRHLLNFKAWKAARSRGIPVVFTPNGTAPRLERKQAVKWLWDLLVDGAVPTDADRVVATSRAEVRQLLGLGVPAERVVRIPNGLWLEEFRDLPPRGSFRARHGVDGPLVAYLGQITPRKGVDHLVAAFGRLAEGTLVVAGSPRGMVPPTAPRVVYTGTLTGPDRLSLLVDADVLVYPSTDEVFGLVPFEGLLCGAPVVVGDDCGCGELVTEAGAGLLVRHGDVDALATAIRALLADRAAADGMVRRGRAFVERHLGFDTVARAYLDVYAELLPTRAGHPAGARRVG